jgi:hypothetical protein
MAGQFQAPLDDLVERDVERFGQLGVTKAGRVTSRGRGH